MLTSYRSLEELILETARLIRAPERLTVAEAAEKYRKLNNVGSFIGDWSNAMVPYLVEPMEVLTSLNYTGMVFAGPAQTGKTDMYLNWQLYGAICDPADMMLVQTAQNTARDFSLTKMDKMNRDSPDVGALLTESNVYDKRYGAMRVVLSWPSINELSGKSIPRLWLTDYDRMDQDVDGEGAPFDLARKRATSFRRYGMTVAESTPGFTIDNPKWVRSSPHEAPSCPGILALYNRGDRRRWYWRCVGCGTPFEPSFAQLEYDATLPPMEAAETATLHCPHCSLGYRHDPDPAMGTPGKHELNRAGRWIKDGMTWKADGSIVGTPRRSDIASFWLKGVAAAFADWRTLVFNYMTAVAEYEKSGDQGSLKTTVNVDQGEAYVPQGAGSDRVPETLKARARDLGVRVVPRGVGFLIGTVDVQKNRFIVQVHGVGRGGDIWIIDRFEIKRSKRTDPDDPSQLLWVKPGAYAEDWLLLLPEVINKTYRLDDDSGRVMGIKLTLCDSGGEDGVTARAYDFWRYLRDGPQEGEDDPEWSQGVQRRFLLLKGSPRLEVPRVQVTFPDSERRDRNAGARGEIPVLQINSNMLKDMVDNRLDRTEAGGGRINYPNWLGENFFIELTVESRDPKKGWVNPRNYRNESWDLLCYCVAATLMQAINIDRAGFWVDPPAWAADWDENDLVFDPKIKSKAFEAVPRATFDFTALGAELT